MSEETICPKCGYDATQYWDEVGGDMLDDGFICSNPKCDYVGENVI